MLDSEFARFVNLVAMVAVFGGFALTAVLESIWPRYHWSARDRTLHFLQNLLIWITLVVSFSLVFQWFLKPIWGVLSLQKVGLLNLLEVPYWAAWVVGFLIADFSDYLVHRISHQWKPMWLLHAVHHSDPRVDVSTSLRQHPLSPFPGFAFRLVILLGFGVPLEVFLVRDALAIVLSHIHHAAIAWTPSALAWLERWVGWLLVTPAAHQTHHSPDVKYTDSNFGQFLSVWDRWLGTYQIPPIPLQETGLRRLHDREWHTWWGLLKTPWKVRRYWDQL